MLYLKFITLIFVVILELVSADVTSISECPKLAARTSAAKDVTDLRIDDIQIIAGLGDSLMAGFVMMGIPEGKELTSILKLDFIREYRGNSYIMGGDTDAITLANFIKYYNPNVYGSSTSSHLLSLCHGPLCIPPLTLYRPVRDNLNAAQSWSLAANLDYELDYLIPRIKAHFSSPEEYSTAWKMITIQIGSNDQCASCNPLISHYATPEAYGKYVESAIQRIQKEIPKTVVNLISNFKISSIFLRTKNEQAYCKPTSFIAKDIGCRCLNTLSSTLNMIRYYIAYDKQLQTIAEKYRGEPGGMFAVMYNPVEIDILSFPIDAFSNFDCFHPSLKTHQWLAKTYWNQMFLKKPSKPPIITYDPNLKIRCPTEDDRLPTTSN
ncbi:hypothetical protein G6F43_010304 [Rhizopus delemar]|nr:hypothetical protein G6F43_010304 [Rhizopus delemar]